MNTFISRLSPYAPIVLRIALSILFIWFGILQLQNPAGWTRFVPDFVAEIMGSAVLMVKLNAFFEIVLGAVMLVGFHVRIVALLLALHLFGIAGSIGLSPLGLRDFALAFATLAVFFAGPDMWSLDRKFVAD